MKKLLCITLSVILIFGTYVFSVNAVETTKISQDLADELQNGTSDTVSVYIWLKEIISESEVERIVAEKYIWENEKELLRLYRTELKNIVEPYVQQFVDDNENLLENIRYQGKLATLIIADVKRENIAHLAELDKVTELSLYDSEMEPTYDEEGTVEPTTSTRVSRLTITDSFGWGQMYVYAWDSDGKSIDSAYPGSPITNKKINSYGETQFVYNLPENAAGIIIGNGTDSRSEEITDFSRYDGYWFSGKQNGDGHYVLTGYIVSEEPTFDPNATEPDTSIYTPVPTEPEVLPTDGGPEYSEIMRKKVSEASIYSNIESDKIEIQIKDSSEGMAYAEDYHENGGKKLLEDFKDYGIISIENCYIDFAYYRVFVTLDKKDRKNVIDTCLELFDNPLVIAATPVTTHSEVHFEKGDVNADEALDIIDAVNIQKFTVDRIGFRDEQKSYGDYNNDGICDILDSTAIQKALVAE